MTGHAKKLSDLGIVIPNRLGINRVLQSLPPSYKNFVMNYNMQNMNKEFPELFGMLKAAEIEIKKEHQVLMVNKTTSFKKQGKSKGKNKKSGKKAATPPVKPKSGPKPDAECYYCKEKGHWKRNCSKYLADLKSGLIKKKKEGGSAEIRSPGFASGRRSPEQQRARARGRKQEEQEREEDEVRQVAASVPSPAAFIADRGGRLASKWRSWPRRPDLLRINFPHDRCRYRKPPHHVAHNRIKSGGDIDVTRRTGGRAQASDRSSQVQDPRRRKLRRAASRSRTISSTRIKSHQQGGDAIKTCEKAKVA
ncbi:hypothetical protein QYE76_034388 [Lolium multiflorum]|uniref:CCHC-type domain-containing protein n=1 Tax=Lolium multiflorum TaxID=4521 RepID=A0AAD8VN18_LOLMU|nr:hypothetical protein QYE76_034388 [Lolium multiflorum]